MKLKISEDLRTICRKILNENKSSKEWAQIESGDMFQLGRLTGGFDATEEEFCFELIMDGNEYWFQFSLEEAREIAEDGNPELEIRLAD